MSIATSCPQGHALIVDDGHSGKPVRCPVCLGVFVAPEPVLQFVVSETSAASDPIPPAAPSPPHVPVIAPPREEVLDDFPAVVFDGQVFALAASYAEFCRGIAEGEPQALEIALADYSKERVAIAETYAADHGESIDAMRQIQRAILGCPFCHRTMSDGFSRSLAADQAAAAPHTPSCEHCNHPRAYLLVVPDLIDTAAAEAEKPEVNVPALLKRAREQRTKSQQADYRRVQWGVTCHLVRQVLQLSMGVIVLVLSLSVRFNTFLEFVEYFIAGTIVCGGIGAAGSYLCRSVPERSYARLWAEASLWLDGLGITCAVVNALVLNQAPHARMFGLSLEIVSMLLGLAAWATFMYFLAHIGKHLKHVREAERAARLVPQGVLVVIVPIVGSTFLRELDAPGDLGASVMAPVLFLGLMAWFSGACWFVAASVSIGVTFRQIMSEEVHRREAREPRGADVSGETNGIRVDMMGSEQSRIRNT